MKKSIIFTIIASALFLSGSLLVSAQESMNKKDKMNKTDSNMVSDQDKIFADMAAMGGAAEIKWAELAMQKSTDKNVKNYAAAMMKDHMKAAKDLDKAAMKNSISLPNTMSDEQMQMLTQLQGASESDFDKMYIQMAGIEAHNKMEQLFVDQSGSGSNKDLVNFARNTISTIQRHLEMAQELSAKMNKSMTMKSDK